MYLICVGLCNAGGDGADPRFGDEFGPAFLDVVATGDERVITGYREVLDHYLKTDLEANIALYYADQGLSFDPVMLGVLGEFTTELP